MRKNAKIFLSIGNLTYPRGIIEDLIHSGDTT
ncbi:unnamed protein product [Brugia timori]|uniref:Metallophosphoesterase n=1 Tax=Brugia timori TaxID=42155 RepID=A0A0R3Q9B8_9BILA|nr:unnamed protein product [Brugia timori]